MPGQLWATLQSRDSASAVGRFRQDAQDARYPRQILPHGRVPAFRQLNPVDPDGFHRRIARYVIPQLSSRDMLSPQLPQPCLNGHPEHLGLRLAGLPDKRFHASRCTFHCCSRLWNPRFVRPSIISHPVTHVDPGEHTQCRCAFSIRSSSGEISSSHSSPHALSPISAGQASGQPALRLKRS